MKKKFNQSNIKVAIASAIMVSSVSLGTAGNAAEEGLLNISALVGEACVIDAVSSMSFTGYDATTTHRAGEGGVNLTATPVEISSTCNSGTTALFDMDNGNHGAGTSAVPTRKLAIADAAADVPRLTYNLYKDSGYNFVFGAGGNGGVADEGGLLLTADGASNDVTIYGAIDKGQLLAAGTYVDTVKISITY